MRSSEFDGNPLESDSPTVWDRLIQSVGPASLLMVIDARMSGRLKRRHAPEDVLQEALLHAWRDRRRCQWRGLRGFRSWLLTIIDNRIRDLAQHETAAKRGGTESTVPFSVLAPAESGESGAAQPIGPTVSTTPSRIAMYKEQADAMRDALQALPPELAHVVRMRLLEQRSISEIAELLGIGESAVRHRFRKGAGIYRRKLTSALATGSRAISPESAPDAGGDSSPTS